MVQLIIFTDLDGTLLDHHTYSYAPAKRALAEIKASAIPLILISSKTPAEILSLHKNMVLNSPFVCENGAAIFWPEGTGYKKQALVPERGILLKVLADLRTEFNFKFMAFADCTTQKLAELTGLSLAQAALAGQREFTEPLLWQDTAARREIFIEQLVQRKLQAQQGGRFLTVMGESTKAEAMKLLIAHYAARQPVVTMALGDSFNDEAMLQGADIAVIIKSAHSSQLKVELPEWIIHTEEAGPKGWQEAMDIVLPVMLDTAGNQQII